jgi:hypothetical protein
MAHLKDDDDDDDDDDDPACIQFWSFTFLLTPIIMTSVRMFFHITFSYHSAVQRREYAVMVTST